MGISTMQKTRSNFRAKSAKANCSCSFLITWKECHGLCSAGATGNCIPPAVIITGSEMSLELQSTIQLQSFIVALKMEVYRRIVLLMASSHQTICQT